jgi:hypothetical protein
MAKKLVVEPHKPVGRPRNPPKPRDPVEIENAAARSALLGEFPILAATESNSMVVVLEQIQRRLASDLDSAPSTVTAQIAGSLVNVTKLLTELRDSKPEVSKLDQLKAQREKRLARVPAAGVVSARKTTRVGQRK